MTKFASLKKIHTKIIIVKRNLELNNLGFLYYSAKACHDLQRVDRLIFQSLREIDEIINFRSFRKFFINKVSPFLIFWHTIFKREKRNEVTGHMKHPAMYGRHSTHCIV